MPTILENVKLDSFNMMSGIKVKRVSVSVFFIFLYFMVVLVSGVDLSLFVVILHSFEIIKSLYEVPLYLTVVT